ncbi:sugar transferase [Curtobacterium sp. MCBD17_013]|uniref:sugar transferase n=1 Tax=unclassified Curtobacterium TaxID=257496 RepID=UPI000DA8A6FD|nr:MULTISPECIES: sugar transferase [unclassified Curtobacterium]PZE74462.1 sugar transferase [Curtobacterium sp. MCBD17_019]PZF66304.1 sugar transferase [Curtobacterium sp. MCBD17_013]WIB64867.1 sugar transferase [Curtobacterium sp. MCBD17_040]WIB68703.1 sugar transferase [Curtobacterium sp. MCBD17_035]
MSNAVFDAPGNPDPDAPTAESPIWTDAPHAVAVPDRSAERLRAVVGLTDAVLVVAALGASMLVPDLSRSTISRIALLAGVAVVWIVWLAVFERRGLLGLGNGNHGAGAILTATAASVATLALASWSTGIDLRGVGLPWAVAAGVVLLLVARLSWVRWIRRERLAGRLRRRIVLVGSPAGIAEATAHLTSRVAAGWDVVASVVPAPDALDVDLPVRVAEALDATGADLVLVTGADALTADRVRKLSWDLEHRACELVVAPTIVDVATGRLRSERIAGLSVLHVAAPTYTGPQRVVKRATDVVGSLLLLAALSPLLLVVAIAVRTTSAGPVFYRQERIGAGHQAFDILKFRSMVTDADAHLHKLLAAQGTSDRPLFKIADDPRLTRIGAFIRRYSIDELPQLVNVLRGDMSLVGPRPQRPAEIALYDASAHRRLKVRPGMTGLWQVSGRSRLSWQEAIRLDLDYVENWSLALDLGILWRTARAVVGSDGAY